MWPSTHRFSGACVDTGDKAVDGFTDREIEHLAVQRGVVTGRATEAEHLAFRQALLASALNRINNFRSQRIDDVDSDLVTLDKELSLPS